MYNIVPSHGDSILAGDMNDHAGERAKVGKKVNETME